MIRKWFIQIKICNLATGLMQQNELRLPVLEVASENIVQRILIDHCISKGIWFLHITLSNQNLKNNRVYDDMVRIAIQGVSNKGSGISW